MAKPAGDGHTPRMSRLAVAVLAALVAGCGTSDAKDAAADKVIAIGPDADKVDATTILGKPAPAWDLDWMGARALAPGDLRGDVVLIRWFTEGCSLCTSSAPTLVRFHDELAAQGLRVLGIYHHKGSTQLDPARVRAFAGELGFRFPVAIDRDWKTLRRWWFDGNKRYTSVSFLLDRRGTVRFVHTGGSYAPDSADAAQLRRWIDQLLREPR
jgi:peroxiredoxin